MPFWVKDVSTTQCKDAGLALVLISLILASVITPRYFVTAGIVFLVVSMSAPGLFRPFAKFWFGFSHTIGTLASRFILTCLYFLMIMPVGLVRRALGKDAMQMKKWKRGRASVFNDRNHQFTRADLDHPY